jgi:sialate O-acetylesterase
MSVLKTLFISTALAAVLHGEVRVPNIFADHLVLQRERPVLIWGSASPDEPVTVAFAAQSKQTRADAEGRWSVTLDPLAASSDPRELHIGGKIIRDVLVGEVWLASGQSNMAYPVSSLPEAGALLAQAGDSALRFYTVVHKTAVEPQEDAAGKWEADGPQAAKGFSAPAYYFARELRAALKCPVAVVHSSWGGTPIETWIGLDAFRQAPALAAPLKQWDEALTAWKRLQADPKPALDYEASLARWRKEVEPAYNDAMKVWNAANNSGKDAGPRPQPAWPEPVNPDPMGMPSPSRRPQTPGISFNAMISPIIRYTVRGALWYQGEANGGAGMAYRELLPRLIGNWRRLNGAEFPFLVVQLPMNGKDATPVAASGWPWLREAQFLTAQRVPGVSLAVTIDIGNPNDVHPTDKLDVGRRLALLARRDVYGEKIVASGPLYASSERRGSGITVRFTETGSGLTPGQAPWRAPGVDPLPLDRPIGFYIADEDRRWVEAQARIEGDTVIVSSPSVEKPVAVRYGWANSPRVNLYNREGLPASPFRTDEWPEGGK